MVLQPLLRLSDEATPTTNQVRDPSGQSHPNMGGDRQPYCHNASQKVAGGDCIRMQTGLADMVNLGQLIPSVVCPALGAI